MSATFARLHKAGSRTPFIWYKVLNERAGLSIKNAS